MLYYAALLLYANYLTMEESIQPRNVENLDLKKESIFHSHYIVSLCTILRYTLSTKYICFINEINSYIIIKLILAVVKCNYIIRSIFHI